MLRVITKQRGNHYRLSLHGTVGGEWVPLLEDHWRTILQAARTAKVVLVLNDVEFIDDEGEQLLEQMAAAGVEFEVSGCMNRYVINNVKRMRINSVLNGASEPEEECMAELTVVGFKGIHRAAEVLNQLQEMNLDWTIDLRDAVAVYRKDDGRLRIDQSVQPTSKAGAAGGGLLGGMLGALLAAPFTAGASIVPAAAAAIGISGVALGATTGAFIGADDAATWKEDYGISEDFVQEVGGMVQPGQSALFALLDISNPELLAERFRGYGGTVLRTTLSPEKARKVKQVLAAHREPATD